MKVLLRLAVSFYLLKQDVARASLVTRLRDDKFEASTWTVVRRRAHHSYNLAVDRLLPDSNA